MKQHFTNLLKLTFAFTLALITFNTVQLNATETNTNTTEVSTYKSVQFNNTGCSAVEVYWWQDNGQSDIYYATIQPNNSWTVNCYPGTMWNFKDKGNNTWMNMYTTTYSSYQSHNLNTSGCSNNTTCTGEITKLYINPQDGGSLIEVQNGATFCESDFSNDIRLRANASGSHESLRFRITGAVISAKTENYVTYDSHQFWATPGTYNVNLKLYSQDNLQGTLCDEKTITFTVTDCGQTQANQGCDLNASCPEDVFVPCNPDLGGQVVTWDAPAIPECARVEANNCNNAGGYIQGFIYMGEYNNSHYYCSDNNYNTWTQARDKSIANGGHLVTINDYGENQFLKNNVISSSIWIGANDAQNEGHFVWANGEEVNYSNWRTSTGEPNNSYGQEHYARMIKNTGEWTDRKGSIQYEFVMEIPCGEAPTQEWVQRDGLASGSVFPTGTTRVSYEYNAPDGTVYNCGFDVTVDVCILPREFCEVTCTAEMDTLMVPCDENVVILGVDSISTETPFGVFMQYDTIFGIIVPNLPMPTIETDCTPGDIVQVSGPLPGDTVMNGTFYDIVFDYQNAGGFETSCTYVLEAQNCGQMNFRVNNGLQSEEITEVKASPNPSNGIVRLNYTSEHNLQATISVFSAVGNEISQMTTTAQKGSNQEQLDLTDLPMGLYYIQVQVRGISKTTKVFITK